VLKGSATTGGCTAEWNAWLAEGGWEAYYSRQELDAVTMPESAAA
jgi:hypothetical protein